MPKQPPQYSYSTLLCRHSLPSAPVVLNLYPQASRVLLNYYTVPQQPPQCCRNSLMYQHNLSSAPIVLYCTNMPYPRSCSTLLYHHILASAPIVLFCTNTASRVSYRTLQYQLSLTTVPVVLYNTNTASPLLLYYSTKLMHPPKCPFTTLPEHVAF